MHAGAIRDSAGVTIVELPASTRPTISSELTLPGVGIRLTGGDQPFYRISRAFMLADGTVAVADGGSKYLRFFDAEGRELRRLGGTGDGPGEFRDLTTAGILPPGSVWAYDFLASRMTIFGPESTVITLRIEGQFPFATVLGVLGREFLLEESVVTTPSTEEGLRRDSVRLSFASANDGTLRPFGRFSGREILVQVRPGANRLTVLKSSMPFSYRTLHAVVGDQVATGETERYELQFRSRNGKLERILRSSLRGPRVNSALITNAAKAEMADADGADQVARLEKKIRAMPLHDFGPAFTSLVAGNASGSGEQWMEVAGNPTDSLSLWVRFGPDGRIAEKLVLPSDLRVTDITLSSIVGIRSDELGVERVEVLVR